MDKGAGGTTVHSVAKNQTQLRAHTHGTLRPDSELPGSKSERGMMTNDKASPHLSIQVFSGEKYFPGTSLSKQLCLHKGVRKHKFNVHLRANAVIKFQSKSKKVKQMGTCLVPTAAAWLVHRTYCEKNSRPHGGQAEKRADDRPHMCYRTPHLGLSRSSTKEQDLSVQLDPKIELWGLKGCMAIMILRCP